MSSILTPICPKQTPCKCCGAIAVLYGVVDFHKNCEIIRRVVFGPSGIPIYYYRCPACQFIFTNAFDHFAHADFAREIYNADYALVDPDYRDVRPQGNANFLIQMFKAAAPQRVLDYGGGNGALAAALRAAGFPQADTYDPFVPEHSARPTHRYDCIVSFEVIEHSPTPIQTFADMNALLAEPGLILFSTLVQPPDIDQQGLAWWYAGPRNGHVSLHSKASLERIAQLLGLQFGSFNDNAHVMFRQVPEFAKHFIQVA